MRKVLFALAAVSLSLPLQAVAQTAPDLEFSATAVQSLPQNRTMTGRLYVSKAKTRQETSQDGQTRVTISDAQQGAAWMLNPDRKEYVEVKSPSRGEGGGESSRMPLPNEPGHPCTQQGSPLTCTRLGTELVSGRQTDKWEFVATQGQETYRTVMWVDQRLRLPVKAEFPGGMASELRDIKEGPQPADLFQVPADYKKIELPKTPPGQSGPGESPGVPGR
jgi:hypothetical protein